jgi:hypothetical protein
LHRKWWEAVGGFPEQLDFGEDATFIVNAAKAGAVVHVANEAIVEWYPRRSYSEVIEQFFHYAQGLAKAGLSRRFHLRTMVQSVGAAALLLMGIVLQHWLPLVLLALLLCAYLWRKARQGCFSVPSWRTYYRVPAILLAIHVGTMAGIFSGTWLRLAGKSRS